MNWFLLYETKSSGMNLWSLYNTATRYATHGLTHDTGRVFSASQLQKLQQTVLFMIQSPTWKSHSQNRYLNPSLA